VSKNYKKIIALHCASVLNSYRSVGYLGNYIWRHKPSQRIKDEQTPIWDF